MKRLYLLLLAAFALFTMSAQKYYVCTGENVYLRTGPGKNYKPYYLGYDTTPYYMLWKGETVESLGQVKNGYHHVRISCDANGYIYGWVATQYLRPKGSSTNSTKKKAPRTRARRR